MDQEHEEIRSAFPEYLTNTDEDEEHLNQCYQQLLLLLSNYKDEQNIISAIESKFTLVINQTPISSAVEFYLNIAKEYEISTKIYKVSKFHDQNAIPSIPILNDLFNKKIEQLPWPTIGLVNQKELQQYLIKIYNFNCGRIALHELPLLWFPTLIKPYSILLESLFNKNTKLTQDEKYYFAIMGVAASGCEQLYELLVQQFYLNDGDKNWIDCGYESVDLEIKQLDQICKLIIQKPWDIQLKPALQQLLKSKWNNKDLINALMIFIFYNNLGSFSLGNGIHKEVDHQNNLLSGNTSISFSQTQNDSQGIDFSQNELIIQELKEQEKIQQIEQQQQNQEQQININSKQLINNEQSEQDQEQLKIKFKEKFQKYFTTSEIQDTPGYQILRSSEYSFQMNSYPVLKEIFPEGAQSMNEFLKEIKRMTRNTFGNEQQITTNAFRKAIRVYGENIYRYQHDDIDYSAQMNKLLPIQLKTFIKLVSQTPNLLSIKHLEQMPLVLSADELCHITLLTVAAKIEVQLIYLSKALVECM